MGRPMLPRRNCLICGQPCNKRKAVYCSVSCAMKKFQYAGKFENWGRTKTWETWSKMRRRCSSPDAPAFHRYGGRGIKVCSEWQSFETFLNDMGPRPDGMTLDRINRDGNYEPANCRWATHKVQMRNTVSNRIIEYRGEKKTLAEWSEITNQDYKLIWKRLWRGWTVADAIERPNGKR